MVVGNIRDRRDGGDRGDRPHAGGNQRPAHGVDPAFLEKLAREESLSMREITWLLFVHINGLEDEAIVAMQAVKARQEARINRRNNIAIVNNNPDDGDVEPAAELHVDDPQPRGSTRRAREEDGSHESSSKRFRRLSDADSHSDTHSDAEEGVPASEPSSNDVPLRSTKRSREEDEDEGDGGDRPHAGGNQRPAHGVDPAFLEKLAREESLSMREITWLLFVHINGLEDEAIVAMQAVKARQEARINRRNNIAIVNNNPDDGDVEPAADLHVDDPQPRGSTRRAREEDGSHESSSKRFRRLSDADSHSDTHSDAEEGVPASEPSSNDVPLRSTKRSREEDEDEGDGRVSKQVRH